MASEVAEEVPRVCKFFGGPGCRNGDACRYIHTKRCHFYVMGKCKHGDNCTFIHEVPEGDEEVECANRWCERHGLRDKWNGRCFQCLRDASHLFLPPWIPSGLKSCMSEDCEELISMNHRLCHKCFKKKKHDMQWVCPKCGTTVAYKQRCQNC